MIWQGIHERFAEITGTGEGYADEALVAETEALTRRVAAESARHPSLPRHIACEQTLLALHLASRTPPAKRVRVVDFGGGMGIGYFALKSCLDPAVGIDYRVIENSAMCARAEKAFADHPSLRFHSTFPVEIGPVDVVYVSSALQYVDDWKATIASLCAYRAPFFFFVKLSAGNMPSYVTAQVNLPGPAVPYRFLNLQDVAQVMRRHGYVLGFRGTLDRIYDQANFPERYRLGQACNLLFCREKPADTP